MDPRRSGACEIRIIIRYNDGARILVLSLTSYFLKQALEIRQGVRLAINYGLNRVRFPAPGPANSKIRARVTLLNPKQRPDCIEAIHSVSMETDRAAKPSCVAEWILRYYS